MPVNQSPSNAVKLNPDSLAQIEHRYKSERSQRLQHRGRIPSVDLLTSERFSTLAHDPWANNSGESNSASSPHPTSTRVLIVGAGFGGLLFAVRLLESQAYAARDITIMDTAGGFGGTWYWNRYPGIMCDVESYIYMPLLEETGYVPAMKYASGTELRRYAEAIAEKWGLARCALFRTTLRSLQWDEGDRGWIARAVREGAQDGLSSNITLNADMVVLASGPFSGPQIPDFPGIERYRGDLIHASRWDYGTTGGSAESPAMHKLKGKTVGVIGTGATAVQAIPHLAAWAKELIVFQRTPSAVDWRHNQRTDAESWKQISAKPGWQRRRMENFNSFTCNENPLPAEDLVGDAWTTMPSFSVLVGGPGNLEKDYLRRVSMTDHERQARIRNRVSQLVSNSETADLLQPWYRGWCKRPCFHDDYLPTFNRENVQLVDLRDREITGFTAHGVLVEQRQYAVDVAILSTGQTYCGAASPAEKAKISVRGRGGKSMAQKWATNPATLHGVVSADFPNLWYPGPHQIGVCANQMYVLDQLSRHVAYIISTALRQAGPGSKVVIEPTEEAEGRWAEEIVRRAGAMAGVAGCTPGYYNNDGEIDRPKDMEELMRAARLAPWGEGIAGYVNVLEEWRAGNDLEGLDIQYY
ncbi:flavin-containing monooxygenase [Aspergillus mulundensis]|uniref:Uncharacterized protein n=1 Tax=Aspergillus mulundensis TaxID=1810919 RepID=A0A3D8RE54_9EURO|nr:Uncharacterized protein DSM5745_07507 [Aspergillus mulundensis]RDW72335.1 Uncharacterized protein DSM5745_07507 [Aspergillus mulundensis]